MNGTPSKTAVSYLRVSTKEQADREGDPEGYSIPAQRDANRRKAEQLGAEVAIEFVDRGESARSANRPQLQALLAYVGEHDVDFVIVHKVDRLARNRLDDVEINLALTRAGVQLVSATENIDETPSGMLLHGIMSSIAEFYSQNLATEVLKGMGQKAKGGGTVGMAPIGYKNVRGESAEGREVRTIAVDKDRAPLVRWAFEAYATGQWSLNRLTRELEERGLLSRPTLSKPGKPLQVNQVHRMLRSPYYRGVVVWRGAEYPGRHEPLVDEQTWRTVQDTLSAKRNGEKERVHNHYLKSSVYCGQCGARLIVHHATNTYGVVYGYYICGSRHQKRNDCTAKAVQISDIEDEVVEFYKSVQLKPELRRAVEQQLTEELGTLQAAQDTARRDLEQQFQKVKDQQSKLLHAHYEGAVPLDLLSSEQDRLGRQRAGIEAKLESMKADHERVRVNLSRALDLIEDCAGAYAAASPRVRRQLNQALFERLLVRDVDTIGVMAEPFASLFDVMGAEPTYGSALTVALDDESYRRSELSPRLERDLAHKGASLKETELVQADVDEIVRLYEAGLTTTEIGEQFGVYASTIGRKLKRLGIELRAPGWRAADESG